MDLEYEIAKTWLEAGAKAFVRLKLHEGFRSYPYRDTVGKTTIGYGRNLDDVGISEQEALFMLQNDMIKAGEALEKMKNEGIITVDMDSSSQAERTYVLIEMVFNLGAAGFKKFKKFIAAINASDWEKASKEMLSSKWAEQVGKRAQTLADIIRTGKDEH